MKRINLLLKIYSMRLFGINKIIHTDDKKARIKLIATLVGFMLVALMMLGMSFFYSYMVATGLKFMGSLDQLPALLMASTTVISLITTAFKSSGMLFYSRDYELLMALPIPAKEIIISRLIMIYGSNMFFTAFVMLPAGAVYAIFANPSWEFYPIFIITFLVLPLIPMILGSAIGAFITVLGRQFKRNNIASLILNFIFFVGIMVLSFNANSVVQNFADISNAISAVIFRIYPLSILYTQALTNADLVSLLLLIAISVVAFTLFVLIIGRSFKRINSLIAGVRKSSGSSHIQVKSERVEVALYNRELRRYFASTIYVLNTAVGSLLLMIGSVALLFAGAESLGAFLEMPGLSDLLANYAPLALSVVIAMTCTTSCSISLEGKQFYILRSLPITPKAIYNAKALVNLTITVPAILISATIVALKINANLIQMLLIYLIPLLYAVLMSYFGLYINLLFPRMDWSNEVQVVKQSMSTVISIFGGMAFGVIPILAISYFKLPPILSILALIPVLAAFIWALYHWLNTKGVRRFVKL